MKNVEFKTLDIYQYLHLSKPEDDLIEICAEMKGGLWIDYSNLGAKVGKYPVPRGHDILPRSTIREE